LVTNDLSWAAARVDCQARGAGWDLAAITSESERNWVDGTVDPEANCWIGANDQASEGIWTWSNGEPWSWADWETDEPNDAGGAEDCAEYVSNGLSNSNDGLNDRNCADAMDYLCEMTPAGG
jgi:C-type mannose receptor